MIKLFIVGLWVSIATLASFYVFFVRSTSTNIDDSKKIIEKNSPDLIESELVTIPIIDEGNAPNAYLFIKLSFVINKLDDRVSEHYLKEIATDYMYTLFAGSPIGDLAKIKSFGIDNFRKKIKEDLNAKLGVQLLSDVLINQLNYVSLSDIRMNCIQAKNSASDLILKKGSLIEK